MATIADVAHAAGVSISTVSYVMSGKRTISQETRDRVERAIAELGYRPHAGARSLASRSTNVIGLQAPLRAGVDVHVIMQIVGGVVREARARHYDILLLTSDDAKGLDRAVGSSMVDALLVMDVESDDPRIETLGDLDAPSVLIGLPSGAGDLTCVDFDFEAAGRLAAERLAGTGHRRIALIGSPPEVIDRHTSYAERLIRGFRAAAETSGVIASVHPVPGSIEAAGVVRSVLAGDPEITGFLVHNEAALPHVAAVLAAEREARGGGIGLIALAPADLVHTVPGVDELIDIPAERIGETGMRVLHELLSGGEGPRVRLLAPALLPASPRTESDPRADQS